MADGRSEQVVADVLFSLESGNSAHICQHKMYIQYSDDRQFLWIRPLSENNYENEEPFTIFEGEGDCRVYQSYQNPQRFAVVRKTYMNVARELFPAE